MKAACYDRYGSADVVEIREVPRPVLGDDEVLVEVHAAAVTTADWRLRAAAFPAFAWLPGRLIYGLFAPRRKILGSDFAGRIVERGAGATMFQLGDMVFGSAGSGAHAEFLAIPESGCIAEKPDRIDCGEAAAVPFGALAALVFLRDFAKVRPGQRVLVHGASGGVGVYAVQLAKHFGAEVTGVCSAGNLALVTSLGADHVIDYSAEDFARAGAACDLILDTVGRTTFRRCRRALEPTGIYLPLAFDLTEILQALGTAVTRGRRVVIGVSGDRPEDLRALAALLERGAIRPVIDSRYPLARIADAHRRVESRHKTGSAVVMLEAGAAGAAAAK